jgi:hypothetical protein
MQIEVDFLRTGLISVTNAALMRLERLVFSVPTGPQPGPEMNNYFLVRWS